jgi:hypothetical protein
MITRLADALSEQHTTAVGKGLVKALRSIRPQTLRHFFALANQHMRRQLDDLARLSDE